MSSAAVSARRVNELTLKRMKMKKERYETPAIGILMFEAEQTIMTTSFTGEGINEWEDM